MRSTCNPEQHLAALCAACVHVTCVHGCYAKQKTRQMWCVWCSYDYCGVRFSAKCQFCISAASYKSSLGWLAALFNLQFDNTHGCHIYQSFIANCVNDYDLCHTVCRMYCGPNVEVFQGTFCKEITTLCCNLLWHVTEHSGLLQMETLAVDIECCSYIDNTLGYLPMSHWWWWSSKMQPQRAWITISNFARCRFRFSVMRSQTKPDRWWKTCQKRNLHHGRYVCLCHIYFRN